MSSLIRNLEYLQKIKSLLNEGQVDKAKEILNSEIEKIELLQKRHSLILIQEAFEKYAAEIVLNNSPNWSNIYKDYGNFFAFTNGISIYCIKKKLLIPKYLKPKQREDSNGVYILREAKPNEMDDMLKRSEKMLGDNKLLVEFYNLKIQNQITTYESGPVQHSFNMKQIDYMNTFLGQNANIYISDKNPIAYGQSDICSGYVLGIRRN